jgi:hypothetical protein
MNEPEDNAKRLALSSGSFSKGPMLFSLSEVGNFPIIRHVNLHLMNTSLSLWSNFFRSWLVDFNSSR